MHAVLANIMVEHIVWLYFTGVLIAGVYKEKQSYI